MCNVNDKDESSQPTAKSELNGRKTMFCVLGYRQGIIYSEFLKRNVSLNTFSECNGYIKI